MNKTKLKAILNSHTKRLKNDPNGEQADISGVDISGVDISWANLSGADFSWANIPIDFVNKFFPLCCPEYGEFIAWKKARGLVVKLLVCEDAKRSSAFGRKCRCSKAVVLAIENADGTPADADEVRSEHDFNFVYRVGEIVEVTNFNDDRRNECSTGIHFFITRQEAVDY